MVVLEKFSIYLVAVYNCFYIFTSFKLAKNIAITGGNYVKNIKSKVENFISTENSNGKDRYRTYINSS